MTTHLIWTKEAPARSAAPGRQRAGPAELAGEHATGPAPFSPDMVRITPPDEHAYL